MTDAWDKCQCGHARGHHTRKGECVCGVTLGQGSHSTSFPCGCRTFVKVAETGLSATETAEPANRRGSAQPWPTATGDTK